LIYEKLKEKLQMSLMSGKFSSIFCRFSIIKIRSIILQQRRIGLQGVSGSVSKDKNKIIWTKIKLLKKLVSGRKKAITTQTSFFLKPSQVAMFWYIMYRIKPTNIKFYMKHEPARHGWFQFFNSYIFHTI